MRRKWWESLKECEVNADEEGASLTQELVWRHYEYAQLEVLASIVLSLRSAAI